MRVRNWHPYHSMYSSIEENSDLVTYSINSYCRLFLLQQHCLAYIMTICLYIMHTLIQAKCIAVVSASILKNWRLSKWVWMLYWWHLLATDDNIWTEAVLLIGIYSWQQWFLMLMGSSTLKCLIMKGLTLACKLSKTRIGKSICKLLKVSLQALMLLHVSL